MLKVFISKQATVSYQEPLRLVIDRQGRVIFTVMVDMNPKARPCDSSYPPTMAQYRYGEVYTVTIENDEIVSEVKWPRGPDKPDYRPEWISLIPPVVGLDNQVYGLSQSFRHRLLRYAAHEGATPIVSLYYPAGNDIEAQQFSAFTRPVMDRDNNYIQIQWVGPVLLWVIDPLEAEIGGALDYDIWTDPAPGLRFYQMYYTGGAWGTPVLTANRHVYFATAGNIVSLDLTTGQEAWRHTSPAGGTYIGATGVLSDGTLLVGGLDGYVYFLKEKNIENGGLDLEAAWPRAYHDNYHSQNAGHPLRWDRTQPEPYPALGNLLADKDATWMCNNDERCYPKAYYETCDWGGTFDWAGKEVDCTDTDAVPRQCPDPHKKPCLLEGWVDTDTCTIPWVEDTDTTSATNTTDTDTQDTGTGTGDTGNQGSDTSVSGTETKETGESGAGTNTADDSSTESSVPDLTPKPQSSCGCQAVGTAASFARMVEWLSILMQ